MVMPPARAGREVGARPLRFVGFDLCHLLLTSPIRPSTTHHFLELSASLDRVQLTRALAELIRDVDRLRSFIRETPLWLERLVAPSLWVDVATLVEWHDAVVDPTAVDWFERPFDVASSPPVRLFHAPRADGGYLFGLTLHHSVADGSGAMLLLDGLLRRYDRLRGHGVALPAILSDGPRCREVVWRLGLRRVLAMLRVAVTRQSLRVKSATLLMDETPRSARFAWRVVDVPVELWRELIALAGKLSCTPNHLLLAASLRAADDVRRAHGLPDEVFRPVVPSDLRTLFGLPRSLPNYIGTVPLHLTPDEVRAPSLPLRIKERVRDGRTPEEQLGFQLQIGLLGLLPPSVGRRVLRDFDSDPGTSAFSFLFSHIRVPREIHLPAGLEVTRLWCASSQGRQPAFGVAVTTIGERTWALVQYLVPYVSEAVAEEFARAFLEHLRALTLEHASPAATSEGVACASA